MNYLWQVLSPEQLEDLNLSKLIALDGQDDPRY